MINKIDLTNNFKSYLVIWYNPHKDIFYYRLYKFCRYYGGFTNQYEHKVIFVFHIEFKVYKLPFRKRFARKLIKLLERV